MKKRLLSVLLVLVMLLTMLPIPVLAEEIEDAGDAMLDVVDETVDEETANVSLEVNATPDVFDSETVSVKSGEEVVFTVKATTDAPVTLRVGLYDAENNTAASEFAGATYQIGSEPPAAMTDEVAVACSSETEITIKAVFETAGSYSISAWAHEVDGDPTDFLALTFHMFTIACGDHVMGEDGFCLSCGECMHEMGGNGYCSVEDCGHGEACEFWGCGGKAPEEPDIPEVPTIWELRVLLNERIIVKCPDSAHGAKKFDLIEDSVELFLNVDEEGNALCTVKIDAEDYVEAYDAALPGKAVHARSTKEDIVVDLVYDQDSGFWKLVSDDDVVINVRCEEPEIFYTIYAEAGRHGSVSNEGWPVYVEAGDDVTFRFYPDKGYEVSAVYVDGYLVNYYGLCYSHHWDCKGCADCRWIDWSKWHDCKNDPWCVGDCWYDHYDPCYGCGDWQDGIVFYDVDEDHELYVEFAPIDDGCASAYYRDLNTEAWYHEATDFVIENDLMKGVGGKYFDPNGKTTRGQLVTMLYRLAGEPRVSGESGFADVAGGEWYTNAVIWAADRGIVDGYGNGYFGVNDTVTREQTVTILYRYAKYAGVSVSKLADLSYFIDLDDVSEFAVEPFGWAVRKDVVRGDAVSGGKLKLNPQGATVRVEMAAMLMRFAKIVD